MRSAIRQILFSQTPFHPRRLFSSGEQGSVHIARDLDTLISTAAGSTPDVSLNGYAGKWLDQSGLGNNATQSTSTARPQLSAKINIIPSFSEQFEQRASAWLQDFGTTISNVVTSPVGTQTADALVAANGTVANCLSYRVVASPASTVSFSVKKGAKQWALIMTVGAGDVYFDLDNVIVGARTIPSSITSASIIAQNDGWYRISISTNQSLSYVGVGASNANNSRTCTGDGVTPTIYLWGADVRRTTDNALPYQRVTSATDYDSAGFPQYLAFDADDALVATYPSSLGNACTVCIGRANATPLILTGQTIGTTYTLNAAVADRVTGLIVVNRALTALETAQVTAYLQARS